jgi:hypothetical protein
MSDLNLTGQSTLAGQVQTRITQLRNAMELRKEVWDRLPIAKKKAWIKSGKDPLMSLAWKIYKYLRNNFFGREVDEDG